MSEDAQRRREHIAGALATLKKRASDPNIGRISEAATKSLLIEPLVRAMGFEGLADIEWEYFVKASNEHIDYVLKVDGHLTIAVEAKPFGTELAEKHAAQLVQYAAIEGIEWCLLTNGRHLRIYNAGLKGDLAAKHLVGLELLADNPSEALDVLSLLSKEGMARLDDLKQWMRSALLHRTLRPTLLDANSPTVGQLAAAVSSSTGFDVTPEHVSRWFAGVLSSVPRHSPSFEAATQQPTTASCWLLPAGPAPDGAPAVEVLRRWLGVGMWGMRRGTPGRRRMRPGDSICFYAAGIGVVARARLAGSADDLVTTAEWPEPVPMAAEVFKVPVDDIHWLGQPTAIDERLRGRLEAFQGKKPSPVWSWFVQTSRKLSQHDFDILIGRP